MDGSVIIKAVLDTVDVSKNIKALERDLQGISWKNITEGDEKAAKLSSSFKKAGTAATLTLTAPVVQASMQQAQQSAEQIAATATDAVQAELTRQTDDALSGVRASLDGAAQALAGIWATFTAPDGTAQGSAFSLPGSNDQPTYSGLAA